MKTTPKFELTKKLLRVLLLYFPPVMVLLAIAAKSIKSNLPITLFLRECKAAVAYRSYVGIVSDIGILLWSAAAAICIFTWIILRKGVIKSNDVNFFICTGLLTTILMVDDFFLIHESVDFSENILFGSYVVVLLIVLVMFRKYILGSDYEILVISLLFFGLSILVDFYQDDITEIFGTWRILLEDGTKFLGIAGWFGYLTRCCFLSIREIFPRQNPQVMS